MSDATNGHRRGIHFVPEIKLGDFISGGLMLVSAGAAYATLRGDITTLAETDKRIEKALEQKIDKEVAGKAELELSRRIVEQQQSNAAVTTRLHQDILEIKAMIRDLARDLDNRLDRKQDKPGR